MWKWQPDSERNKKGHQWTDTPGQTLTEQRTRKKWVYLSETVMISIDFNVIYPQIWFEQKRNLTISVKCSFYVSFIYVFFVS